MVTVSENREYERKKARESRADCRCKNIAAFALCRGGDVLGKFARKKADCLRSKIFGIGYGNFRAKREKTFGNFRVIEKGLY